MAYSASQNNNSKKPRSKPHADFDFKKVVLGRKTTNFFKILNHGTKTYENFNPYQHTRSPVKRRNAYQRQHDQILKSGYRLIIGTIEQNVYVKGPARGVWNKVESL